MRVAPHVLETGRGDAVVLLHAFPLTASMWLAQREALGATHRVLTPDQRGFGGTMLGHDEPSLDEVADDLAAMLDEREIPRAVIGGLSMGGYVAMAFARRHPEKLRALVLADTKPGADPPEVRDNRLRIADAVVADGHSKLLLEEVLPGLVGETTKQRRPLVHGRVRALVENAPPYAVAWAQRAMAARPDSSGVLRSLEVPTLVVVGEEDTLSPPAVAEEMAALVPGAELVRIPGAGHLTAVEAPDDFNAAVAKFLESLPA